MIIQHCKLIINNRPWDGQEAAISWLSILQDQLVIGRYEANLLLLFTQDNIEMGFPHKLHVRHVSHGKYLSFYCVTQFQVCMALSVWSLCVLNFPPPTLYQCRIETWDQHKRYEIIVLQCAHLLQLKVAANYSLTVYCQ